MNDKLEEQIEIKSKQQSEQQAEIQPEKQLEQQTGFQSQKKVNDKLELTYPKETIQNSNILFLTFSIAEVVLFIIGLYFTATYVDAAISGNRYIILDMVFFLLLPLWIGTGVRSRGIKRWKISYEKNDIMYYSRYKSMQEFHIKDISVIEITRNKMMFRNQYHEILIKENILTMPGGIELLYVMRANQVPIEYLSGAEKIKQTILERLDVYEKTREKGMITVPWHKEGIQYAKEPESPVRDQNERKHEKFAQLISILAIVYMILTIVLWILLGKNSCLLILGLFLLIFTVLTRLHEQMTIKLEGRIRQEGQKVMATMKEFRREYSKNSIMMYPIFEFELSDGVHICEGIRADQQVNLKNYQNYINKEYQIYYAPMLSSTVSYGSEDSYKKFYRKTRKIVALTLVVTSAITIIGGEFAYQGYVEDTYTDAGMTTKITYNQTYQESSYTQDDVSSDTVLWICATCGIYNYVNHLDSTMIGGANLNSVQALGLKSMIDNGWGIKDRTTAIDAITELLKGGHRQQYHNIISSLKKEGLTEISLSDAVDKIKAKKWDEEKKQRYIASLTAYADYGDVGIDAWDYCRAIQLLQDCYVSGYISLEECLDQSLPIAQLIQSEFDSWDDMNESYLYGYWFWTETDPNENKSDSYYRYQAYEELQSQSQNPFDEVRYDTTLMDTWSQLNE